MGGTSRCPRTVVALRVLIDVVAGRRGDGGLAVMEDWRRVAAQRLEGGEGAIRGRRQGDWREAESSPARRCCAAWEWDGCTKREGLREDGGRKGRAAKVGEGLGSFS
ncbi:unnamed protein product [Linum trigynum]|uniref:Uncharacterized protein n=1 Tax=Linum trigynum TaxID=586398 RepID=A0AAV2CYE2_9ROSI